jgi:hypothetical protein
MFTNNIEYFKSKPVNIPKITILLDHGYHIDHLVQELQSVSSNHDKIRFELSKKHSKQEKKKRKEEFRDLLIARWVVERSNAWVERFARYW